MSNPPIGAIVIFTCALGERAAIVTLVDRHGVGLSVCWHAGDKAGRACPTRVPYDPTGAIGTWRRVEADPEAMALIQNRIASALAGVVDRALLEAKTHRDAVDGIVADLARRVAALDDPTPPRKPKKKTADK